MAAASRVTSLAEPKASAGGRAEGTVVPRVPRFPPVRAQLGPHVSTGPRGGGDSGVAGWDGPGQPEADSNAAVPKPLATWKWTVHESHGPFLISSLSPDFLPQKGRTGPVSADWLAEEKGQAGADIGPCWRSGAVGPPSPQRTAPPGCELRPSCGAWKGSPRPLS